MRKLPSFSALRAFEAAARLGGFAHAAKALHLTPSAVSHQVKALEGYLQRELFLRRNRRVVLTEDGTRLYQSLTRAFDTIEAACSALSPQSSISTLSVHCTPSFASKWLGPRLPSFIKQHADIRLQFSSTADPIDLVRRSDLDIAIAYAAPFRQPGIEVIPLGLERIAVLCAPSLADSLSDPHSSAWHKVNLIESVLSPVKWEDWFALEGIDKHLLSSRSAFDRGALSIAAAAQGLGVALESTRFAEAEISRGELVEPGDGALRHVQREAHFLCYRENQKSEYKIKAFRSWLLHQTHTMTTLV